MRAILFTAFLAFLLQHSKAQSDIIPILSWEEFEKKMNTPSNTVIVYNFWATWCVPCVKELPYFEQLHKNYTSKNVKVVLVSLDSKSQYEKSLKPFVKKNKLTAEVLLLNDTDYNSWIDKVNPTWEGSIPATLAVKGNPQKKIFVEKQFESYTELESFISPLLN